MSYTVKKLAEISGVSVRTLHFYDEIGLLKPAYVGENKYRYYGEEQLLTLQQILFFRELGFQLDDIARILGSEDFDKIEALASHRHLLEQRLEKTHELLKTIDKTINHLKGKTTMNDKELFYGFDSERQRRYEQELIDSGKVTAEEIAKGRERFKHWTKADWKKWQEESDALHKAFVVAIKAGLKPEDPEVQKLVRKHHNFFAPDFGREKYIGLGQMYCDHPEFRKFYEHYHPKLAEFLAEAMRVFAERELS